MIGGKYVTEISIDTDSDHVIPYGDIIVRRVYILQHIIVMVALC